MEIKIQIKGVVYSLCFGHKTKWFGQLHFITLTKEYYGDDMCVGFAESIFQLFNRRVK